MSRRTINIITPHYTPEITAAAHRMEAAARSLSTSYKVHVITLAERGTNGRKHSVKYSEYLTVHYLPVRSYSKSVFLIRAFFEWWYSLLLVRESNKIRADLAIVTVPFMFLLPVAASWCRARYKIADVRDLVWHYLPSASFTQRIIRKRITSWMHQALTGFQTITVTNEREKKWLMHHAGFREEQLCVIPNGVSREKFIRLAELDYRPHPDKFTITYIGNVGTSQHFLTLIDAVKSLKDVRLNLVGNGNEWRNLQKYVTRQEIKNVFFCDKRKWERTLPYYQVSDLLFASLKEEYDTAIPSKLYEYLATGLPVFYLGKGAAADFLDTFGNTFVSGLYDASCLERIIWKVRRLSPVRSGKNIDNIKRHFIREKLSMRFAEVAARLLNEKELSDVFVDDFLMRMEQ